MNYIVLIDIDKNLNDALGKAQEIKGMVFHDYAFAVNHLEGFINKPLIKSLNEFIDLCNSCLIDLDSYYIASIEIV